MASKKSRRAVMQLTGDKKTDKKLHKLDVKMQKKIVRQAERETMKETVLPEAKANAPSKSGTLKKKMKIRAGKRSQKGISIKVQIGDKDFDNFYPKFVEWGTKHIKPRKFMRNAFLKKKDVAVTKFRGKVWKKIDQELGG